ncbi:MAG: hypothetical protein JST39_09440, partial [Bacteroidetes bacterium]|nr:hypothetical protein [Bacteroidota bacterium]
MKNNIYAFCLLVSAGLLLTRCSKKDDFAGGDLSDFVNPKVGKYITYRMDSTVWTNFGQTRTIRKYLAKDIVDGTTT